MSIQNSRIKLKCNEFLTTNVIAITYCNDMQIMIYIIQKDVTTNRNKRQ